MNSNWIWAGVLVFIALMLVVLRFVPKEVKKHVLLPKSSASVNNADFIIDCPASCESRLRIEGPKMIMTCVCQQDSGLD